MFTDAFKTFGFLGILYFSSDYSRQQEIIDDYKQKFGGKYEYLTILGLQATIYTLAIGYISRITGIKILRLFYLHVLPVISAIEFIITVMFWVLNWINPGLLKTKVAVADGERKLTVDNRYIQYILNASTNKWVKSGVGKIFSDQNLLIADRVLKSEQLYDLFVHLMPFLLLVSEIMTEKHIKKQNIHRALLVGIGINYIFWASFAAHKNKKWVYPFLNDLSFGRRMFCFGFGICLALIGYEIIMLIKAWHKKRCSDD